MAGMGGDEAMAGGIGMSKDPRLARLQKLRMRTESMEMVTPDRNTHSSHLPPPRFCLIAACPSRGTTPAVSIPDGSPQNAAGPVLTKRFATLQVKQRQAEALITGADESGPKGDVCDAFISNGTSFKALSFSNHHYCSPSLLDPPVTPISAPLTVALSRPFR